MVSRVKFFAEYRKQIGLNADLIEVLDYNPKHLLTKLFSFTYFNDSSKL